MDDSVTRGSGQRTACVWSETVWDHTPVAVSVAVAAKPVVSGQAAAVWGVGILLLVVLLEFAPKLGGALLAVIVVYLALQLPKKGVT